jgi:hypothetical protein
MEDEKKRGRLQKRSSDSSESSILLALRRLNVGQRSQTLFSERTHPYRESSQINLRIVNRISESINLNNRLSQSLFTDNSLFINNNSLIIDFSKLTLFNFGRAFSWSDAMVIVKLRTIRLLVSPDDPELYKCPNYCNALRRVEEQDYVLDYRYRCKDKLRSGTVNPAENTWFSGLRATEKELNPLLRSLKVCFSYLCGIRVGISAEVTESNRTEDYSAGPKYI